MPSTEPVREDSPKTVTDHRRIPMTIAGVSFPSLREACAHHGVRLSTYFRRRRAGHSPEQALGLEPITEVRREHLPQRIRPRAKSILIQGVTYPSKTAALNAFGVSVFTFHRRLKLGWTTEEALGVVPPPAKRSHLEEGRPARELVVNGIRYESLTALAQAHQLTLGVLSRRLKSEPDRPLDELVDPAYAPICAATDRSVLIAGVRYASLSAACRAHQLDVGVFHARRRSGWTDAQALGVEPRPQKVWPSKSVQLNGVTYTSMREACEAHQLEPGCVNSRLANGWSLAEAFGLEPRKHTAVSRKQSQAAAEAGVLIIGGQQFRWK